MPGLSAPTLTKQTGTVLTNLGPDGITWAQAPPVVIDPFGKLVLCLNDNGTNYLHWTWSNDAGVTWATPTTGPIDTAQLIRGSFVFDGGGAWVHVLWNGYNSTDGIIYRRYAVTRDGSNNITNIATARDTNVNLQIDFQSSGTMTFDQPVLQWIPEGGANGSLLAMWPIFSSAGRSEVRASMRVLSLSVADNTASNWLAPVTTSSDSLGNPPTVPYTAISVLGLGAANATPGLSAARKTAGANQRDVYVFYIEGAATKTLKFRRMQWNSGTNRWSTGMSSVVNLTNIVRGGTDTTGYNLKYQLLTQPRQDPTRDRVYVGLGTYKDNANRDTWSFTYVDATDTAGPLVDVYAATTHSDNVNKFVAGDISVDKATGWVAASYTDLPAKNVYIAVYEPNGVQTLAPTLVSSGAPFDVPTMTDGRLRQGTRDVLLIQTRDFNAGAAAADGNAPTYTPPYNGWFGRAFWDTLLTATQPAVAVRGPMQRGQVLATTQPQIVSLNVRVPVRTSMTQQVAQLTTATLTLYRPGRGAPTLAQYRRRLADAAGFNMQTVTTGDASTANQLIIGELQSTELEATFLGNTWEYQGTGPNAGQVRRVVYGGLQNGTGIVTVERPHSVPTPAGIPIEIVGRLPPARYEGRLGLNDIVNRVLEECWTVQRVGQPVIQDQTIYPLAYPYIQWQDQIVDVYWQPPQSGLNIPLNGPSKYDQLVPTWTWRSGGDGPSIQIGTPLQVGGVLKPELFVPMSWWCNQGTGWPGPLEGLFSDTDEALLPLQGMEIIGLAWIYGEMAKFGLPDDQANYRTLQSRARAAANHWKRLALPRPVGRKYHWPEMMIVPSAGNYSYQNGYPWSS